MVRSSGIEGALINEGDRGCAVLENMRNSGRGGRYFQTANIAMKEYFGIIGTFFLFLNATMPYTRCTYNSTPAAPIIHSTKQPFHLNSLALKYSTIRRPRSYTRNTCTPRWNCTKRTPRPLPSAASFFTIKQLAQYLHTNAHITSSNH